MNINPQLQKEVPFYTTSLTPTLYEDQCKAVGPCLLVPFLALTHTSSSIAPMWMEPLGNSHSDLLDILLTRDTALVFNTSGAGKTKLAFSLGTLKVIILDFIMFSSTICLN
jgi:hypothetical protein